MKSSLRGRVVTAALLLAFPLAAALPATEGAYDDKASDAVTRLTATMRSAVEGSPRATADAARLQAEVAEIRSETGAGAPVLSWQQEGIGSGFDKSPNAASYLRLTVPFTPPWQRGRMWALQEATAGLLFAGDRANRLDLAMRTALQWLELAAETEMTGLMEERVERLGKALETQSRRYELGEISGSERRQLELELARDQAALQSAENRRFAAWRLVASTTGKFPPPVLGDLGQLAEKTAVPLPEAAALEDLLAEGPQGRLAETRLQTSAAQLKVDRRSAWGRPEFELEWERIPALTPAEGFDAAGFRIAFPLPFGKQGRQKLLAAQQRADAAAAERDQLQRELRARLGSVLRTARTGEATLRGLSAAAEQIPFAEHSLAKQFRLGAISYLVYLDGLSRLDEVRRGLIENRYTLLAARLELAHLLGTDRYFPLPELEKEGSR